MVPLNDLKRIVEHAPDGLMEAVARTIRSGWWLNGDETKAFCERFAAFVGVSRCIGVANGTDALEIAMRVLAESVGADRTEVVTVANAGGYSSVACRLVGLTPVYADIEEASQLISIGSAVAAMTPNTAFVVATHLYGGVVDVPRLRSAMDDAGYRDVPILEDCAQAHGVRIDGRQAGSMGDLATFSFYPTKNLGAFGDGGAIVTSDAALADRCAMLRQYGWGSKYRIVAPGGRNSRLDEVQAAILSQLLPRLEIENQRRVAILDRYAGCVPPGVRMVRSAAGTVAHLAVALCENRDGLKAHLLERGVQSDVHYPILDCDQPGWQELDHRLAPGGVPVSRASVEKILTLPCFPSMSEAETDRVCGALADWRG